MKAAAKTWIDYWNHNWRQARRKGDASLARLLAVKDCYASHLKPFVRFLGDNHLDLDLAAVKAYFVHVNGLPLATATKLIRRQAVKARLRAILSSPDFTQQAGLEAMLRSLDFGSETRAPAMARAEIAEDRIVTLAEFDRLVAGTSKRTSLFIWFLYNTGCRAMEMCTARLQHTEDLGDMVRLRVTGKRNKDRKVDIQKSLYEFIRATFAGKTFLFETKGGKPFRPPYVSYEITKAGHRILKRRISAHTMRHSFATLSIREGASIKAVSVYLGHSSIALTLKMYVHENLDKRQRVMRTFKQNRPGPSRPNVSARRDRSGATQVE